MGFFKSFAKSYFELPSTVNEQIRDIEQQTASWRSRYTAIFTNGSE